MFFILSKILSFLSNPISFVIVCLLVALATKNLRRKKIMLWSAIIIFYVCGNIFFVTALRKIWDIPSQKIETITPHTYGIVLGGASRYMESDSNRVALNHSGDRLVQAVQLYKMKKINKILFTGGDASILGPKHPEAVRAKIFFKLMGIPDSSVLIESNSRNTYENALFSKALIESANQSSGTSLLITNAIHMRRSLACFDKVGLKCDPFPVDDVSEFGSYNFMNYLFPDTEMIHNTGSILHEMIGMIAYKFKGYI